MPIADAGADLPDFEKRHAMHIDAGGPLSPRGGFPPRRAPRAPQVRPGPTGPERPLALYALSPGLVWAYLKRQTSSFWFLSGYLFFEYVRPQQIYTGIAGPPYSKICIGFAVVAFLMEGRRIRWGFVETCLAIFSFVVLASSMNAVYPAVSLAHSADYFNWVIIYFLIANIVDSEGRFIVFVLLYMVWNFKMSLSATKSWAAFGFHFRSWGVAGAPGYFENSGEFGIEMVVFLAALIGWITGLRAHWSNWKLFGWLFVAFTAALSIVASSSRGAMLACVAVVLSPLLRARKKGRALVLAAALLGVGYQLVPAESKARFDAAGTDETSVQRKIYWAQAIMIMKQYPALGIGFKNWMPFHSATFDGRHQVVHNIFLEAGAELGFAGLSSFLLLIGGTFAINRRTRKLLDGRSGSRFMFEMAYSFDVALWGYMVAGFFVTVLYYPFFWINLAFSAALHHAAVASASTRGVATPARPRLLAGVRAKG